MEFRRLTPTLLAALLFTCPLDVQGAAPRSTDFDWLDGLSLVLLDTQDAAGLHAATSAIHAAGGRVGLLSLPNVVVGWIPPAADAALLQRPGFRRILRDAAAISPATLAAPDVRTQRMLQWFDEVQSGRLQRSLQDHIAQATPPSSRRPGDALVADPADPMDTLLNLRANGFDLDQLRSRGLILQKSTPGLPRTSGNSDRMTGTVSLTVLFVESDGTGADADLYDWTPEAMQSYVNSVNTGLLFWTQRASLYNDCWVAFFVHYIPGSDARNQQWREMVLHPSGDVSAMVSDVMANHGYNAGSHISRVDAYNTAQRAAYGTDWAYAAFVAANPPPASTEMTDGRSAFAYLLGPYTFLLQRSYNWAPSEVFTHESGHIFGACDEYAGGCTACNTCLGELNNNCEDCPGGTSACMMKQNSFVLCGYTDEQVGWQDGNPCAPPILAAPVVTGIDPPSLPKGVSGLLTFTGSNFLFGAFPSLGAGVSVDSTVVTPGGDTLRAYVSVSPTAALTTRNAVVKNRDLQNDTLPDAFTVTDTRRHYFSATGSDVFPYITPAEAANSWADAIAAADSGDSVLVETGTVALSGGYILSRGVTLYGGYSNAFTQRDLSNDKTILDLSGGTLSVLANDPAGLDGFVLENGSGSAAGGGTLLLGEYGGAILVNSTSFLLRHCEVRNNQGTDGNGYSGGGGLFAQNADVMIDDVVFTGNSANRGGALYLYATTGLVRNSTFTGNSVAKAASGGVTPWGAAVVVEQSTGGLSFEDNAFEDNTGAESGGALYVLSSTGIEIVGGQVLNHTVTSAGLATGGGIELQSSAVTLQGVVLANNTSGFFGGGLNAANSDLDITECVFDSNSAALNAGFSLSGGTATVRHCLFRNNIASISTGAGAMTSITAGAFLGNTLIANAGDGGSPGGLLFSSATVDVVNNIIVQSVGHGLTCSGTAPSSLDYNLVWGSSGDDWDGCTPGAHALSADPRFASGSDDHLGLHSPALDSGDPDPALQDPDGSRGDRGRFGSHDFATLQPSAPQGLAAGTVGNDLVLSWTANPESDIESYAVYCDTTMNLVPSLDTYLTSVAATDTSLSIAPLPCNWFTLAAIDSAGYSSGFAALVQASTDPTNVLQPTAKRFHLHPNTPNPFNPLTRIDFELDRSRRVRLAVYDLAGRRVRLLVDRVLDAGRHSSTWDGRDQRGRRVASGIYFSRLVSGEQVQTRKMVLLK